MSSKPVRTILTVIMDLLVVLAIAVTARLVVEFFGALSSKGWGEAVLALTRPLTIPFGVDPIKTPYGGVFDVDAALTIAAYMLGEWALGMVRSRD